MRVLICLMAFAFLLGGCGIQEKDIQNCERICSSSGGVHYIHYLGFDLCECVCRNGDEYFLTGDIYTPEPKVEEERPEISSF